MERVSTFAPYAALALLLAGLTWMIVGAEALRREKPKDGGDLYNRLGIASWLTGIAFVLIFVAWLG